MALHEYQKQMYKKMAVVAALIILPIAGFFTGMAYQRQTNAASGAAITQSGTRGGRFGGMMHNRGIGTVKAISATSITITERFNNTDKTYTLTSSTAYTNGTAAASASDVKTGSTVMLTLDPSDTTKVTTVTLNPRLMFRGSGSTAPDTTNTPGGDTMVQ